MKFSKGSIPATILAIFLLGCPGTKKNGGEAVTLRLNLEKGKIYNYNLATHFDMSIQMMGQKMLTGGDVDYGYKLAVADIDTQGNRMVNATIGDMKFKMSAMGRDMGYDSKNIGDTTKEDMMSGMFRKMFGSLIGKNFRMTISPKAEITKLEGVEELANAMIEGMPGTQESKVQMRKQMIQTFNAGQIKQSFTQAFNIFPDKPVKEGDSWTKNMEYGISGMQSDIALTFLVKEVKAEEVILGLKGIIKAAKTTGTDTLSPKPVFNMNGDESGTMVISRSTGLPNKADIDMNMTGTLAMKGNKSPIDMKGKVSITAN